MGTEVHCKSHVPGYYSMRDINEDSNSSSWSLIYGGDRNLLNGQYCNNGFMPRTVTDGYPGYEKDVLKQKMLEHEAIFKNQVYELHRLYRVQRDMMEEVKKKEVYKQRISIEASSSSSHLPSSQMPSDEAKNWHIPSFPLPNPGWVRPPILGTSEGTDSPLSCTKGNSTRVPCSSKDYGLSDSRPSKVRKKLFDLQLPADEYIDDTEEGQQIRDTNISDVSSYHPTGNHRLAPDNGVKLFLGGGKTDGTTDTSSDPRLKKSHGLADLNEPIQVEETTPPLSVDSLGRSACHGEIRGLDLTAKPKSQFIDLSQEYSQNSQHGSCNGNLNNQSTANKGNTRGWLSCMYEAGNSGRDRNCVPQFLQPEQLPISSHSSQFVLDKAHQHPYIFPTDFRREEPWMERSRSYEISDRNRDNSNNHPDSVVASRISNQYPFFNPSDAANSWSQSVTSWGKPNTSFTQKLSSVPTRPSFLSSETSRSARLSAQTHEIFGDKWHANGISRLNPGLGGDLPIRNGFYHGSSSGSKELSANLSLIAYDNLNGNRIDVGTSENLINNGSTGLFKGSDVMDLRSRMDVNLNMVPLRNSSNEVAPPQSHEILDGKRKREDHLAVLPWLREKPVCNQLTKKETVKDPIVLCIQNVSSSSSDRDVGVKRDSGDSPSNGKLFGVPIFGKKFTSKNDTSSLVSSSASIHFPPKGEGKENEGRHKGIDINVACDLMDAESRELMFAEALVVEKGTDTKFNNFRNIDLNSCISEEEDILGSSLASTTPKKKIALEIDLEAPVVLEPEEAVLPLEEHSQQEPLQSPDHKDEHQKGDEVDRIAAEAIVDISLSCFDHPSDACLSDSLLWLADVIEEGDHESKVCKGSRGRDGGDVEILEEIDEFEMMTLQLEETREEDYMPKPFVPEFQEAEETGPSSLPSRTRKGQARRGRQRRDFQRDILPGLVSLSRHEVTEDLQTFGGLMRATGHQWNGGLTRKARGRRRCVVDPTPPVVVTPECTQLTQQLNNSIEVAGLEDRSLTGWGKTTRRPRRQRCPAGNNLAVALT